MLTLVNTWKKVVYESKVIVTTITVVTAIIVTYRGLDTLGEVTVLFLTAAIVGLVLSRKRIAIEVDKKQDFHLSELLITGSRLLVPLIIFIRKWVKLSLISITRARSLTVQ